MGKGLKVCLSKPYFPRAALTGNHLEFWIGREPQIHRLVRGLLASTETHYLVTGYPGVGKTSFVSQVVAEWRRMSALQGIDRVLVFNLQFVRPQPTEEVVQRIAGKVYFGSLDGQFSPDKHLAERLHLSFIQSNSKSLKELQAQTINSDSGGQAKAGFTSSASLPGGEVGASFRKTKEVSRSLEIQREYNLSAALSDLESVLHLLTRPENHSHRRFWQFFRRVKAGQPRVLFVFDQIDDLGSLEELSSLFSLPNASFLVIGGMKLKEQVVSEQERGTSTLDNFQEEYLSCQWNSAHEILSLLVSEDQMGTRFFREYRDYLNFQAQGLPRRVFSAIDQHTLLEDDVFYLHLTDVELQRVRLCARLHRVLWKNRRRILGDYIDNVQDYLRDKALRGMYHLADRVLRVVQFDLTEVTTVATQVSAMMMHTKREKVLQNILDLFVAEGILGRSGNMYSLSDDTLKRVTRIPNWLKDGFVDGYDLFISQSSVGTEQEATGVVDVRGMPSALQLPELSPSSKLSPGMTLQNKYTIVRQVGQGGMGEVYLATDNLLQRPVALKIIAPSLGASADFQKRFMREARLAANLSHPNIVSIYDLAQLGDRVVLVSEYVEGQSLQLLLHRQGKLTARQAISIAICVAQALTAAHSQNIVHRDVKPSNVLISDSGVAKLTDFGIARAVEKESSQITQTGALVGTVEYMAPEQIDGSAIDPRTDIYALGAILYEMVTGRRYLEARTSVALMYKIKHEQPLPPSKINASVPQALDRVVMRCLAKNPQDRFASADELAAALQEVETGLDT